MAHTNWHYPRSALAKHLISGFEQGLADRVTIFAPRKRGKTEFVVHDITPMARDQGILVVYVDFWRYKSSPARAFATAVMTARRDQESWFSQVVSKSSLKTNLNLYSGDLSVEVAPRRKEAEKVVVESAFEELEATKKPILLLLDEVQHLATDPQFSDFTAALRSLMTARSDHKVKGIFTGSSQEGLAQLFKRTRAPFYGASANIDFPDLGEDFVEFELEVFRGVSGGVSLEPVKAKDIFNDMGRSPGMFIDLLKKMVLEQVHDLDEGVARFADALIEEANHEFQAQWKAFSPLERALLLMISRGETRGLYRSEYKEKIQTLNPELGVPTRHSIQNAVNRLKGGSHNVIYSIEHGVWLFTDPSFEQFVRNKDVGQTDSEDH